MTSMRSIRYGISTALFLGMGFTLQAGPELLVRAKGRDGKESNLFEKIIITSSLTSIYDLPKSDAQNRVIEPFSVYFHLKGDDGSVEKNGFIRVGDGKGKPFGWIPKKDQKDKVSYLLWNTRFVLEPVDDPKRKFVLLGTDGKPLVETDKEAAVPEGKRKFALVTDVPEKESGEDTQYPVAVYVGKVATKSGSLEAERNEIADLKLEIVFVVEALTGMVNGDKGVTAYDSVLSLFEETTDLFENDPELKSAIKYGLVDFKDKWDVLLLSLNLIYGEKTEFPYAIRVYRSFTTAGYVVHKRFAQKLLDNFKESAELLKSEGKYVPSLCLDNYMGRLQQKTNWFSIVPRIGLQLPSYSDIEYRYVDYKC